MGEELKVGIKESLELLEGVKLVTVAAVGVLEDGKVDLSDLGKLLPLLQDVQKLVEAAKGVNLIVGELKDLEESEVLLLGAKVWEIVKEIKK